MHYREKLWPSFGVWLLVPLIAFMCAVAVAPIAFSVAAIVAGVVACALAIWAAVAATRLEVTDQHFLCGDAKLPLDVISAGTLVPEANVRREMGPDLDARAFVTVRGWIPTMVRLTLDDPEDDTPYWLVSSRRPEELLAALQRAHPGEATWTMDAPQETQSVQEPTSGPESSNGQGPDGHNNQSGDSQESKPEV